MIVNPNNLSFYSTYIQPLLTPFANRIDALWKHICYAYHAKPIQEVTLATHPTPNTYPKQHKIAPWPNNLDIAAKKDAENIDLTADPLEQVTPLHAAVYGGNEKAIYRLFRDGADVNGLDIRGQSPAYWAAYHGNLSALMILANLGAKLDAVDYRGKTPLRAAAKYGHTSVVSFLISQKVELNQKDGRGATPLEIAAFHRRFSVFETLVYHKAEGVEGALQLLKKKCMEVYHSRIFPLRLFTSPNPPKLIENCHLLRSK